MVNRNKLKVTKDTVWKIRGALEAANYTQDDIATAIQVTRPYFNRIVTKNPEKRVLPSIELVSKLSSFFNIKISMFLSDEYTAYDVYLRVGMEIENGTYKDKGFVKGINGNEIILSRKPGDFKDTFFDERKDYEYKQVGGTHYRDKNIQPWDIRKDWKLDPWTADSIRYISRHQSKNGKEDIEKAIHCLEYVRDNYEFIINTYFPKSKIAKEL